jgi:hypothetical protein
MNHLYLIRKHQQYEREQTKAERQAYDGGLAIDWNNPSSQMNTLFSFLNVWGRCRLKREPHRLLERLKLAGPFLQQLKDLPWTCDLEILREVGGERLTLQRIVQASFDVVSHDGPDRFGCVAASKLLHAFNPNLFVPWDNAIREDLELKPDGFAYTFQFLPKMMKTGEAVIRRYIAEHPSLDTPSAVDAIQSMATGRGTRRITLAKLIDECNWLEAKKGRRR